MSEYKVKWVSDVFGDEKIISRTRYLDVAREIREGESQKSGLDANYSNGMSRIIIEDDCGKRYQ